MDAQAGEDPRDSGQVRRMHLEDRQEAGDLAQKPGTF